MRYGIVFGLLLFIGYVYAFFGIGVYFIWNAGLPVEVWEWVKLILSSAIYLAIGLLVFIPVLIISLVLIFRDRNIPFMGLPILVTLVYALLPIPVPGPIDEAIVFALDYWLRVRTLKQFGGSAKEDEFEKTRSSRDRRDSDHVIDVEKINRD